MCSTEGPVCSVFIKGSLKACTHKREAIKKSQGPVSIVLRGQRKSISQPSRCLWGKKKKLGSSTLNGWNALSSVTRKWLVWSFFFVVGHKQREPGFISAADGYRPDL